MIKKLKRKFTLIFMCLTTATLLGMFTFIFVSTWTKMESDCRSSLKRHLTEHSELNDAFGRSSVILTLKFSQSGRRIESSKNHETLSLSKEEIEEIADECLASESDYGILRNELLAYMKTTSPDGTVSMAFYDLTSNYNTIRHLLVSFLIGGIAAIFLFYIASRFLSIWCVRPIEETWNSQKKFVADASHELKTPLTVILTNTAIMKEHPEETISSRKKCISYIEEEAGHMSRLVNDMLFLAKTDAYHESIQKEKVNFSEICMNACLTFEALAFEKNIMMETDIEENLFVNGVGDKLEQFCVLLLDNACKYADEHGFIRIFLHKKGSAVLLKINNSGTPIPKEDIPHLFERFYRADKARTRSHGSYGLGLSIAYSIVQMHHGKISIESSEEKGTSVLTEFPSL